MEWVRIATSNDANGNPRRLFVAIENGDVVQVVEEGYVGISAAYAAGMPKGYYPITINVAPAEYRATKNSKPQWPAATG